MNRAREFKGKLHEVLMVGADSDAIATVTTNPGFILRKDHNVHGTWLRLFFRTLNIQKDIMRDSVRKELDFNTCFRLGRLLSSFTCMNTEAIRVIPESCFAWQPGS